MEQARNLDGVIWENYAGKDSRKYAEAFAGSKVPLLLLTREKEQEQDSIFLNKRNEAHQVVHAASSGLERAQSSQFADFCASGAAAHFGQKPKIA